MIIPLGFAQANVMFSGDAAPSGAEVTFGLNVDTYAGSPTQLAEDIWTQWSDANLPELYVGALTLDKVYVKFGPNEDGPFGEYAVGTPGTGANPSVSINTALLVSKLTPKGGRKGRGRLYLPGTPDNQADADGTVHSGFLSSATDDFNDFLGKCEANSFPLVLLHNDEDIDPATTALTAFVPQAKMATQRRRLRR